MNVDKFSTLKDLAGKKTKNPTQFYSPLLAVTVLLLLHKEGIFFFNLFFSILTFIFHFHIF